MKKRVKRKTKKHKKKNNFKIKFILLCILCIFIWIIYIFILQFENEVIPTVIRISEKYATNIISQEINKSVEKVIEDMSLYSNDFLKKSVNETNTTYLDVDTILINNVIARVSDELTESLKNLNDTKIALPVGIFSGIHFFSSMGPNFSSSITSIGDSKVDYETNFKSVGINQINFQVYLIIDVSIALVNPLYKQDISITRKLMLVNTVFNGEVPSTYLSIDKENS